MQNLFLLIKEKILFEIIHSIKTSTRDLIIVVRNIFHSSLLQHTASRVLSDFSYIFRVNYLHKLAKIN